MRDSHLTLPQQIHDDILCARYLDFQTVPRSFSGLLEPLPFMERPPQPKVRQFHVDDKKKPKTRSTGLVWTHTQTVSEAVSGLKSCSYHSP